MVARQNELEGKVRRDKLINTSQALRTKKVLENTRCPRCGVFFKKGRWQWTTENKFTANIKTCPACIKITKHQPDGLLILEGKSIKNKRQDIINLVFSRVREEKKKRPMKRLIEIEQQENQGLVFSFSDAHSPTGIGKAIANAYNGKLELHYEGTPVTVKVTLQN